MRRVLFGIVLALASVIFMATPAVSYAQNLNGGRAMDSNDDGSIGSNPFFGAGSEGEPEAADSVKKKQRIKKPLESYFFNDSVRSQGSFAWSVDGFMNRINMRQIDTMLPGYHIQYPYLKEGVGDAYLGNYGAASLPLNYAARPQNRDFSFANAYRTYFTTPENARFFNVKKPYTHLMYMSSGQKRYLEDDFAATHAQNVNPSTGFNVDYKSRGARGVYAWQRTRDKNLSLGFSHTGKKYSVHAGYIYNMASVRENGGLVDDRDITDSILNYEITSNIPMKLSDARNKIKNNSYFLVQSFGIPLRRVTEDDFSIADFPAVFIGHSFEYNRWYKKYTDTYDGATYTDMEGEVHNYYENWYINPRQSNDSIFESSLSNRVFVQIQPWNRDGWIGQINGGVGVDVHHYYQFAMNQYLTGNRKGENKVSYYAYGAASGKIKKYFDWGADIKVHPFGYRMGDVDFGAQAAASVFIKGKPLTLSGRFGYSLRSPGYWSERYFSNHYVWDNSFDKENETRIEVSLQAPIIGMEIGAQQSILTEKIYFDRNAMPAQKSGPVSVSGLYVREDVGIGGLHLNHRVLLQWSTDQSVVPVPLASAFLSYYYEFNVVKNVLRLQVGMDGRYNTEYYAPGYNPATAQFYNQREKMLGNYIMLDAFVSAKWKRMRILLKAQHWNEDLFGRRNYFTVLHYPLNPFAFKLGFSWSFYD